MLLLPEKTEDRGERERERDVVKYSHPERDSLVSECPKSAPALQIEEGQKSRNARDAK